MSERRPLRGQRHRSALCQNCRSRGCRIIDQGIPSSVTHHTQEARRVDAAQVLCDEENVAWPWTAVKNTAHNLLKLLLLNTTRGKEPPMRTLPGPLMLFNTTRTTSGPPSTRASIAMDEGGADTTCYDTGPADAVQHNARHAPDPCWRCCCCETQTRTLCCCCKGEWSTIFHVLHNWFYKGHGVL